MLMTVLSSPAEWEDGFLCFSFPRQSLLEMIAGLVRNATQSKDPKCRIARYRQSLLLWSSLFQVLSERQGKELECRSRYWPSVLRRRFNAALEHRCRMRWPHKPYPAQILSLRFKGSGPVLVQASMRQQSPVAAEREAVQFHRDRTFDASAF